MTQKLLKLIGLYFAPGVLLTVALYTLARPLAASLDLNLWLTQILLIFFFLFLVEGILALRLVESPPEAPLSVRLKALGLVRPSLKELAIASLFSLVGIALMKAYAESIGYPLMAALKEVPLFALPEWHYQMTKPPPEILAYPLLLTVALLGPNVFFEELFFRGLLFAKTEALIGKYAWILNGLLFIAYHIFQPAVTYAFFPLGLLIAGYYYWRRDLYGSMLIHLLFNLFGH